MANGWVIAGAELALFLLPISVVEYMPNFFYGSLLMVFGVDISQDWLVHSFHKVSPHSQGLLRSFAGALATDAALVHARFTLTRAFGWLFHALCRLN